MVPGSVSTAPLHQTSIAVTCHTQAGLLHTSPLGEGTLRSKDGQPQGCCGGKDLTAHHTLNKTWGKHWLFIYQFYDFLHPHRRSGVGISLTFANEKNVELRSRYRTPHNQLFLYRNQNPGFPGLSPGLVTLGN